MLEGALALQGTCRAPPYATLACRPGVDTRSALELHPPDVKFEILTSLAPARGPSADARGVVGRLVRVEVRRERHLRVDDDLRPARQRDDGAGALAPSLILTRGAVFYTS